MTLARRWNLTDLPGYTPIAFIATAFVAGVQIALVVQAAGGAGYPPDGKAALTWSTLAALGVSATLHLPSPSRVRPTLSRAREAVSGLLGRRAVVLEPYFQRGTDESTASSSSRERTNGHAHPSPEEVLPKLSARVHSPLSAGPVVAPGEPIDLTIEAEPAELAEDLTVAVETRTPEGSRQVQRPMEGTEMTHELVLEEPGSFEVTVALTHPRADPVSKTLTGSVSTYREEVGRLFEELKERMASLDLDVGPQSTPREVCTELDRVDAAGADRLADLAVELEIALYGDEEIDRSTYETVHQAIEALSFEHREVAG